MKKTLYTITIFLTTISVAFAQPKLDKNKIDSNVPVLLVNSKEKKEVELFKIEERKQIEEHKKNMHDKRLVLKQQQAKLLSDVKNIKNNGDLTNEQKNSFRIRQYVIKAEAQNLLQININFMKKIKEQRAGFYKKLKN